MKLDTTVAYEYQRQGCLRVKNIIGGIAECRCSCGETVMVPEESIGTAALANRYRRCPHEKQGCYTPTGELSGLYIYARCTCGVVDAFDAEEEWLSGKVGQVFKSCPHEVVGQVKGCMRVVALSGVDSLELECSRCARRVCVPRIEWALGSWDAEHDCEFWQTVIEI